MKRLLSVILFLVGIAGAGISYYFIYKSFGNPWFKFTPIFLICVVTFIAGLLIYIGALLLEHSRKNR